MFNPADHVQEVAPRYLLRKGGQVLLVEVRNGELQTIEILFSGKNKRQASTEGQRLSKKMAIPYRGKEGSIPEIKEAKDAIRQRDDIKALAVGEEHWLTWRDRFNSDAMAMAELIRYLNKYAKRFPKYKEQTHEQTMLQEMIYSIKDEWLSRNVGNLTEAFVSARFTNEWIDYDELHMMRDMTGQWQDEADYYRSETTIFYAYSFNIEGQEFRFHSKEKLVDICPDRMDQHGATEPLDDGDLVMTAAQAILAARFVIGWGEGSRAFNREFNEKGNQRRQHNNHGFNRQRLSPIEVAAMRRDMREAERASYSPPTDSKWISLSGLKAEGWTEGAVLAFLGQPELFAKNPHYKSAAPMRLYERERAMQVMESQCWQWWRSEMDAGRRPGLG